MKEEIIGNCTIYQGDYKEIIPLLPPIDLVVTDPPYGMSYRSNYRKERYEAIANDDTMEVSMDLIDWAKNNWSAGDLKHEHARQTELIFFYPGKDHAWRSKRPTDLVTCARSTNTNHPTEKPIQLMETILSWTQGIIVFDPFMGSGTTGVACIRQNLNFIGCEINEQYFETACERLYKAYHEKING